MWPHDDIVRPPKGTTHVVLDTPAGLHGKRLDAVMRIADRMLIPLQPSLFDIQATHAFVQEGAPHRAAPRSSWAWWACACVNTRKANEQLHHYLATLPVPVVGWLRDTQNYVQLAARGLTLWDVAPSRVERDLEQWAPLADGCAPDEALRPPGRSAGPGRPGIGVSDWMLVDQRRIDLFAQATGDHQWIHTDPVRAAAGPFGATVAHGFLTLSLVPAMLESAFAIDDVRMGINYGLNRVRFMAPVRVGSRLRGRFKLLALSRWKVARSWWLRPRWNWKARQTGLRGRDGVPPLHLSSPTPQRWVPGPWCGHTMPRHTRCGDPMKVLLVDDHPLVLAALQAVIQSIGSDTTVVGVDSAAAARATLAATATTTWCCWTCRWATPTVSTCWSSSAPPTRQCRWWWCRPRTAPAT
jgi:acyl dehydratase